MQSKIDYWRERDMSAPLAFWRGCWSAALTIAAFVGVAVAYYLIGRALS